MPSPTPSALPATAATSAPASPTLSPPTPSAATTTAAPGALQVSATTIDLGRSRSRASFTVTNTGGTALSFLASTGTAAITATPASQILEPGASATVRITVDRPHLVEGPIEETVRVSSGSLSAAVRLTGDNEVPPEVGTPRIGTSSCTASGRSYRVSVVASDAVGVKSVKLVWSGVASGSASLASSPDRWSGLMGPFATGGSVTVRAVATDARGNTATSAPRTVDVTPCPQ